MTRITPKIIWASGVAMFFLVAHLFVLPSTLEDIDSLNFALGIHDFDPAKHQPHPPGYPIFIALAKIVRVVAPSDAIALALLGIVFGAAAVFPMLKMVEDAERLAGRPPDRALITAALSVLLAVTSPLYWFGASRPLSDVAGLAFILAAQSALVSAFTKQRLNPERTPQALADSGRMIVLGAFLSAIAIGMRSQAMWLTLPLLAVVIVQRAGRSASGALLGSALAFGVGTLAWAIPLLIATGGPAAYLAALGAQGGEDFAFVDMLYLNPTPRKLALTLLETFIQPWASPVLGWVVFVLATAGSLVSLRRSPRVVGLLAIAVGPYLLVHMLLQDTVMTRYVLPLMPAIAYLAVRGAEAVVPTFGSRGASFITALLVVWSLLVTQPSLRVYAREGAPAFAAIAELRSRVTAESGVIGLHHAMKRSTETQDFGGTTVLPSPPMREWLELAKYWRDGNTKPVWFLGDPARTDIELIDPLSRHLQGHYVWEFPRLQFMGGIRPDIVDLVRIDSPPGWFAEEGWHLTPETLTTSERQGKREGVAYVRSRSDSALLIVGLESTGADASASITIDGKPIETVTVPARGRSFKKMLLAPGTLANGSGLNRLVASYSTPDGKPQPLRLTEFALAPPDALFAIQHAGWNEIEYSRELQRRWRWTTGRAETFINSGGKDVTLRISGESPLKYFDTVPRVVIRAGSRVLTTAQPADDFEITATVTAADLAASGGIVTIETDKTFVPHERSGSPDRRTLGLRVFELIVR